MNMTSATRPQVAGKLAAVTFLFWVMKICATTLGETAGDLLSMTLDIGYIASSAILLSLFVVVLVCQLRAKTFHPFLYWSVILATSTAGTTTSDFMNRTLQLGYAVGSAILLGLLIAVLAVWRLVEGSLAVGDVRSRRAELFYWAAILCSNTLGTALGDYLADDSGLGFAGGATLIGGVLMLIALAYFLTDLSRVALFWAAFVLTRPFGATMGDVLTKGPELGGLGFGTIGSSLVLAAILVAVICYTKRRQPDPRAGTSDVDPPHPPAAPAMPGEQ
ncbi:MAG: hypothetical protein U0575_09060 [Phycisphaerales bacterium]|jgi:uncharacterized membrane-anchored protein